MLPIKNKIFNKLILLFSIFALLCAYFIQYFLGREPCNLCLIERIPYFAALILISLMFIINKYEKKILIVVGIFFIFGAIVSFYHVGIEQGIFNETLLCDLGKSIKDPTSAELLKELQKKTISCKDVTFSFLGVSLATFNTLISTFIAAIIFKNIINYEKNR